MGNSADVAVSEATLYRYTVHNRSAETIEGSRVSFFADIDLGEYRIRFYTVDPYNVPAEPAPEAGALALAVHPNPVRSVASVPYALAASGRVRLSVVDVLGREVAVLADGDRPGGEHRAVLDARALAAGVYVVVLDTEAGRASRTLTVVR